MAEVNYCIDCGKEITKGSKSGYCRSCANKGERNSNFGHKWNRKQKSKQSILTKKNMDKAEVREKISGKNHWNYKDGRTLKPNYCINCGEEICYDSTKCQKCYLLLNVRENHWNWQDGKSFEEYPQEFSSELKAQIRKRDNYECQICKITEEEHIIIYGRVLDCHHIDYNKKNCNELNLVSLCLSCNIRVNYNKTYWKQYFKEVNKNGSSKNYI